MHDSPIKLQFSSDGREVMADIDQTKTGGMPVVAEQFLMALEEVGAENFEIDYSSIDRLIQTQGSTGKMFAIARKINGSVEVAVSSDKMEASVTMIPPKGGKEVDVDDVKAALAMAGVRFGQKEDVIQNIVAQAWYNEKVVVAEGTPSEDGQDGKIEFLFNVEDAKPKPTMTEEGDVDYYELGVVSNVHIAEPLAEKTPPTTGKAGRNVLGEEIPARPGKDTPFPIGKNVTFSQENPNLIVSQIAGQPRLVQGKIHVLPVFEVKGDVDFSTGNISFVGDVIVKGGILEGFVVKADSNVSVYGPVSGCVIEAGGSVFLNKGMHGQDKGVIVAGEDVVAKFLEHTTVKAGGNIRVSDGLILSNVTAKKSIVAEGKKGVIVGGRVSAGEEVRARVIGNYMATPTEVEAGGSPKVREELRQIEEQKKNLKLNLDRSEKGVKSLKLLQEKQGTLPPAKRDLLLQLTRAQFNLMGQLKKLEAREEELEEILASSFKGKVTISDAIYPGVKLIIKQAVLHIRDQINSTVFYEQDGEVQVGVYG